MIGIPHRKLRDFPPTFLSKALEHMPEVLNKSSVHEHLGLFTIRFYFLGFSRHSHDIVISIIFNQMRY